MQSPQLVGTYYLCLVRNIRNIFLLVDHLQLPGAYSTIEELLYDPVSTVEEAPSASIIQELGCRVV